MYVKLNRYIHYDNDWHWSLTSVSTCKWKKFKKQRTLVLDKKADFYTMLYGYPANNSMHAASFIKIHDNRNLRIEIYQKMRLCILR